MTTICYWAHQMSAYVFVKRSHTKYTRYLMIGLLGVFISSGMLACGSDTIGLTAPDRTLLRVLMNTHAVTLATAPGYDTLQLSVVAYRGNGELIPGIVPTYTVSDNTLYVTPEGMVTGVKKTVKSYVVARVTYEGVTRTDTTWITVIDTNTPASLQSFAISVFNSMSAGTSQTIGVTAFDENNVNQGAAIPVHFRVSDDRAATVDRSGLLKTFIPERKITVYATSVFYGVLYTDSTIVTIGYPQEVAIRVNPRRTSTGETLLEFIPNVVYAAAGASVVFCNCYDVNSIPNTRPIDVVFETPEAAQPFPNPLFPTGSGNIPPFMRTDTNPFQVYQVRRFPTSGTYHYHSELSGSRGTIIVR